MRVGITVPYKGNDVEVIIEDDIAFGKIEDLLETVTEAAVSEDNAKLSAGLLSLSQKMVERVVIQAPWDITKEGWVKEMGMKTNIALVKEVSKAYPLTDLFTGLVGAMTGQ